MTTVVPEGYQSWEEFWSGASWADKNTKTLLNVPSESRLHVWVRPEQTGILFAKSVVFQTILGDEITNEESLSDEVIPGPACRELCTPHNYRLEARYGFLKKEPLTIRTEAVVVTPTGDVWDTPYCNRQTGIEGQTALIKLSLFMEGAE